MYVELVINNIMASRMDLIHVDVYFHENWQFLSAIHHSDPAMAHLYSSLSRNKCEIMLARLVCLGLWNPILN